MRIRDRVRRGERGYYPCAYSTGDHAYNKVLANYFNAHEGISKAQAAAMLAGSLFGWEVPAADPARYDAEGIPVQPGERKAPVRSQEYQYEQAKLIRHDYQPGTKVVLDEKMEDPYREMPAGLTGIVDSVDDLGQIHCHWENGSSLALIPGVDRFQMCIRDSRKRLQHGSGKSRSAGIGFYASTTKPSTRFAPVNLMGAIWYFPA